MRHLIFLFMWFPSLILANTINIDELKLFPVAQQMQYVNGDPATTIETGALLSQGGELARGPHTINFTLSADATYSVVVDGITVAPGETVSFVKNLSLTQNKLILPVYPATAGVEGAVNYTIDIPVVQDSPCEVGQTEVADGCITTQIDILVIDCPVEYQAYTENGITCENYTTQGINLDCDTDYAMDGTTCRSTQVVDVDYDCLAYPGSTLSGTMCLANQVFTAYDCDTGYDLYNGNCRKVASSYNATLGCAVGTWNGSQCVWTDYVPSYVSCPSGYMKGGVTRSDIYYAGRFPTSKTTQQILADISGATCHLTAKVESIYGSDYESSDFGADGRWYARYTIRKYVRTSEPCPANYPVREAGKTYCWTTQEVADRGTGFQKTTQNTVCPSGYTWHLKFDGRSTNEYRQCVADAGTPVTLASGRCWNSTYTYSSSTGKCSKTQYADRVASCPSGGTLNNNNCLTYDTQSTGNYCHDGGTYDAASGDCLLQIDELASKSCRTGFLMQDDELTCLNQDNYEFKYCDDETYSADADLSKCERTLTAEPVLSCEDETFTVDEPNVQCYRVDKTGFLY